MTRRRRTTLSGLDDRLGQTVDQLSRAVPPGEFQRIRTKKVRLGAVRRLQVASLVVVVLAATAGGSWALSRAFLGDSDRPGRFTPTPKGNGKIAFVSEREGSPDIFVMEPGVPGEFLLTDHPANDFEPTWSPDGSKVAFSSDRTGGGDVYVVGGNGSDLRQLTRHPAPDTSPAWSPDGKKIAFIRGDLILVVDVNSGVERRLRRVPGGCGSVAWSPDGTRIAFDTDLAAGGDIFVMNADGTEARKVYGDISGVDLLGADSWSPDGTRLLYTWGVIPFGVLGEEVGLSASDVYVVGLDGSAPIALTDSADASGASWSPNGTKIVFHRTTAGRGPGPLDLYVMNSDGGEQMRLTVDPGGAYDPAWQPVPLQEPPSPKPPLANGVIAFFSIGYNDPGGTHTIYTIDPDGTDLTRIIGPMYSSGMSWSPDGTSLAFGRGLGKGESEIVITELVEGGETWTLTTYNNPQDPAWSPDGTRIAFFTGLSGAAIHVISIEGGEPVKLTDPPSHCGDTDPAWSPDGSKIAFNRSCSGKFGSIHVMNADGTGQVEVTQGQGAQRPAWSPDGSRIAFHDVNDADGIGIWLMNPDGTALVRLSPVGVDDLYPTWSPDGTMIAFVSNVDGNQEIYVMNADGTGRRNLTNDPADNTGPDWKPVVNPTASG
jgi:Tol biopolymer transport system component